MTALRWGSATDTGLVRRNNQDSFFAIANLFAVADGMGGHVAGEVASKTAVEALAETFGGCPAGQLRSGEDLAEAVRAANRAVFAQAQADTDLRGMGTTMTAAALVVTDGEERLAVANVGDSRAYVFTHGELEQLTEDHSVPEELVRQGQLDPGDVDTHPQRHILTRAMGIQPEVEVDLWEILPYAGDRVLLCSDGLVREVTDDQISSVLRRLADPHEVAQELVAKARAGGGSDNITVVVIDVVDDGGQALSASGSIAASVPRDARTSTTAAGNTTTGLGDSSAAFSAGPTVAPPPLDALPLADRPVARRRRITLRVVVFVILLGLVLGGAAVAVISYARSSYYVTVAPGSTPQPLEIYQGRPGGTLWFKPSLAERSAVTSAQVLAVHLPDLQKGRLEPSLSAARQYVKSLLEEAAQQAGRP
ncbi:MAG: protein phosphatase 2C domain-containing protein [Acidimicrobiales bacterium]